MVKKTNKNNAERKNSKSNKVNAPLHLSQEPNFPQKNLSNDDLIMSLANAYENERARQVVEWERVQRRQFSQAF